MAKGRIYSTESFGSVDGPGIRFIIFVQGCRMRCRYCHNVDTWDPIGKSREREAEDVLDQAVRYKSYWGRKGGITVSGGEPLLQMDFLLDLMKKAKERGIHTVIDTAGQPFTREEPWFGMFRELMEYTDLLLVDIKHIVPEEHRKLTAQPNDNILDMLRYLSEIGKPVWIRHVLVPGITDEDEYLRKTRAFLDTLTNIEKVEVLPYHALGIPKWEELGIPYTLREMEPPTPDRVKNAERILRGEESPQVRER